MRLATGGRGGASRAEHDPFRPPVTLPRLSLAPVFLVLALVAGCVGLPGGTGEGASTEGAGALAAEAIAVTPLDGPAAAPAVPGPAAAPAGTEATAPAKAGPAAAPPAAPEAQADEAVEPEAAEPEAAEAPAEAAPPPPPKSPEQLACERRGGTWSSAGGSGIKACVRRTRDGGKQCVNGTQCEGDCLARSQSCSPIAPLFGCNDILQDNGARVTQCIE